MWDVTVQSHMIIRAARELGMLIRETRRSQHLTQATLAAHVGVSRKWLGGIEAGKPAADLTLVLRTLRALALEVDVRPRTIRPGGVDVNQIVSGRKRKD